MTLRDRPIFLVGFMGSGKSSCGRALATALGRDFFDTDLLVERRERRSIPRIFSESGERYFREAEREALHSLQGRTCCVVATGGGLFLGAAQRKWMKQQGLTVWLDVTLEEARRRVGGGATRPLWRTEDPVSLRALFERRRASYALCAIRVPATSGDPTEVAERIVRRIP